MLTSAGYVHAHVRPRVAPDENKMRCVMLIVLGLEDFGDDAASESAAEQWGMITKTVDDHPAAHFQCHRVV
jgi:hypothetical protein